MIGLAYDGPQQHRTLLSYHSSSAGCQIVISRFEGTDGNRRLVDLLRAQTLVAGNDTIANALVEAGELVEYVPGAALIVQGDTDDDVYFLIVGNVDVVVNGRRVASRAAGTHVGEMVLVSPAQSRSASVIANDYVVALKLSEPSFFNLAESHPVIWRRLARELAKRLEQRNSLVTGTHDRIQVFVMSSVENLELARSIQNGLEYDAQVTVWTDGVFRASQYTLESLEAQVADSDFAIAIVGADDTVESRDEKWPAVRDNVLLELGMFIGRLGRSRSILVEHRGDSVKLPSDLAGLTTLTYRWSGMSRDLPSAMAPVCNRIRGLMSDLGPNN